MTVERPVKEEEDTPASPLPPLSGTGGPTLPVPQDAPPMRIGRAERDLADQQLRQALHDDVLTITEYDERLGLVMGARTQDDLDRILADLPGAQQSPAPSEPPLPECSAIAAVLSTEEQRGRWRPAKPLRVVATMGTAIVDLRDAVTTDGTFHIDAKVLMGSVEVVVPDDATVVLTGFAVMGEKKNTVATPAAVGGPHVTVNGHAVMGSVQVRTANRRERKRHPVAQAPGHVAHSPWPDAPPAGAVAKPRWVGKAVRIALLAALVLGPGRAIVTADAVAVFGSNQYNPTAEQLAGEDDVDVLSLFGSVEVVVPETHSGRVDDVLPLFGSTQCNGICEGSDGQPEVEVDGMVIFGSVEVGSPPRQPAPLSGPEPDLD